MADRERLELYKQHRAGESKYTYFLLAAAASAIAFAVQKTSGFGLSWFQRPLAFAVLSWRISFYCGCQSVTLAQRGSYMNSQLFDIMDGVHPMQPPGGVQGVQEAKSAFCRRWMMSIRRTRFMASGNFAFL